MLGFGTPKFPFSEFWSIWEEYFKWVGNHLPFSSSDCVIDILSFQILSFPIPSSHSCKIASSFVGTPLKQRYITSQLPNGWLWLITFLHASKDVDWVRGDAQRSKWRWSFFAEVAGHGTVNFFCGVYIISGTDLQRGITLFYLYRSTDTLSVFFCKTFNSAL